MTKALIAKCWCIFICRLLMLGNKKRIQPMTKVTCHRSKATPFQRIRCVHEDPWAHQSIPTHIHDMGAYLVVSWSKLRQFGRFFWSADRVLAPLTYLLHVSTFDWMLNAVQGGPGSIWGPRTPWHPPIYMRGGVKNGTSLTTKWRASLTCI
jgi:hypothetical protein